MEVKIDEVAAWVCTMMEVLGTAWGIRCLVEKEGGDPVKVMLKGNDILGRLAELKRSGQEVI